MGQLPYFHVIFRSYGSVSIQMIESSRVDALVLAGVLRSHHLLMTTKKMCLRELSGILGRMRELVLLLQANPEPQRFVVLLRELSVLFNEAGGRLRQFGG